jgi:hypothetical protein
MLGALLNVPRSAFNDAYVYTLLDVRRELGIRALMRAYGCSNEHSPSLVLRHSKVERNSGEWNQAV